MAQRVDLPVVVELAEAFLIDRRVVLSFESKARGYPRTHEKCLLALVLHLPGLLRPLYRADLQPKDRARTGYFARRLVEFPYRGQSGVGQP